MATTTISSFVPADYTVWAIAGAIFITGALDFLFSLGGSSASSALSASPNTTTNNNNLQLSTRDAWRRAPRALMFLALTFWGSSLILPLNVLWGPSSVVAGVDVTSFTSQGWLCRIFITLCLGICAPIACILGAVILYSMVVELDAPSEPMGGSGKAWSMLWEHPIALALLITLPFGAAQGVIAWISLTLSYEDKPIEESPSSLISTWLSPYVPGNTVQCGSAALDSEYPCTSCVFPAASVLVHGVWTVMHAMATVYAVVRLRNRTPAKTLWFAGALVLSGLAGLICMGVSIYYHDPFTWANQGLWLGYVATVLVTAAAISYLG